MKLSILILAVLAVLAGCTEKPTALGEPAILVYYQSDSPELCATDSLIAGSDNKGSLMLLTNNKTLFALRETDTIRYYRGTYRLIENGIFCSFDSWYSQARASKGKTLQRKKNEIASMLPIEAWSLNLQKTGCGEYVYYSEGNAGTGAATISGRLVFKDADNDKVAEVTTRVNKIPALIDFHLKPSATHAKRPLVPAEAVALIEKHYSNQNKRLGKLKRIENDTAVRLLFSYRKRPKGEPPGPYLYVTIPRQLSSTLRGDMNGDGREDMIVQPVLSQGGGSRWREFFLFLNEDGRYVYKTSASTYDLAQHKPNSHSGSFQPSGIVDGAILGTSVCYRDEDSRCCPSVKVPTMVKLEKNRLRGMKQGAR